MTPAGVFSTGEFICRFEFRPGRRESLKTTKIMTKLKNILRCYAMGMGIKGISSTFSISRNTVRKYVRRYQESGLSLEKMLSMSEEHLEEMFMGSCTREQTKSPRREELEALIPDYAKRLSRKGTLVKDLFAEYSASHPDGYKHSQFETLLRRYMFQNKAIGHVEHPAGDQMYIDFAGDRLKIIDELTDEVRSVEVFVAILPCSQYTSKQCGRRKRKTSLWPARMRFTSLEACRWLLFLTI